MNFPVATAMPSGRRPRSLRLLAVVAAIVAVFMLSVWLQYKNSPISPAVHVAQLRDAAFATTGKNPEILKARLVALAELTGALVAGAIHLAVRSRRPFRKLP